MSQDKTQIYNADKMEIFMECENTGLNPEKLVEIDEAYTQQAKELAEYKRLEEQGLLLRLPCKVDITVYCIRYHNPVVLPNDAVIVEKVASLEWIVERFLSNQKDVIGETTFLTREEAEAKLEELRGNHGTTDDKNGIYCQ